MKYFEMIRILELKYFDLFFKILVIVIFWKKMFFILNIVGNMSCKCIENCFFINLLLYIVIFKICL